MNIVYRRLRKKDEKEVFALVEETFRKYNGKGVSEDVIEDYLSFLTHDNFLHFLGQESLVAECDGKVIGFTRGRNGRISNLFVYGKYHERGIGRRLTEKLEKILGKKTDVIKIRSSLYAIDFYEKLGYMKTTGERKLHGIPIQPMKKILARG